VSDKRAELGEEKAK